MNSMLMYEEAQSEKPGTSRGARSRSIALTTPSGTRDVAYNGRKYFGYSEYVCAAIPWDVAQALQPQPRPQPRPQPPQPSAPAPMTARRSPETAR